MVALASQNSKSTVELVWIRDAKHELLFESQIYYEKALETIQDWFRRVGCPV